MSIALRAALAAVLLASLAPAARAQTITLMPADPGRWDVAVYAGRHGANRYNASADWDQWYGAGQAAISVGFFLTPNLKVEADASRSGQGSMYVLFPYTVPGQPWPYNRSREHRFSTTGGSAAVVYQFLQNQWFHPFVGAGVEVARERERADALPAVPDARGPTGLVIPGVPTLAAVDESRVIGSAFGAAGFKLYVARQAFLRSDLRVGWGRGGDNGVVWRAGIGVDF